MKVVRCEGWDGLAPVSKALNLSVLALAILVNVVFLEPVAASVVLSCLMIGVSLRVRRLSMMSGSDGVADTAIIAAISLVVQSYLITL